MMEWIASLIAFSLSVDDIWKGGRVAYNQIKHLCSKV